MPAPQQKTGRKFKDWHRADIKGALEKRGWTFARIARMYGYQITSTPDVLRRRWPVVERIVADIIGVEPWEIWPNRYDDQGRPLRKRPTVVQ